MSKKTLNIALAIVILAGIMGLIYVSVSYGAKPDSQQAPTLAKDSNASMQLDGTLVSEKNADLGFVISANIATLTAKVGDTVKAGDILATEDSTDIKAQVSAAEASLAASQAQLDVLNHNLKGATLKLKDFSGNAKKEQKTQVSSSKSSIDVQTSAIAAAQDNLTNAQAQLAKTVMRAPFDGIITRQDGQVGEVGGATVAPFMTISSIEPLKEIDAFASDLDVSKIKVGDSAKVVFDILGTQKVLTAKVVSVDPEASMSQGKSAYKVTLDLDQTDASIKAGMHASVSF